MYLITFLFFGTKGIAQSQGDSLFTNKIEKKSPRKASFYSAVLPGLGQIYNEKAWKVPILYAGAAVLGYYYNFNNNKYREYKDNYLRKIANDPNNPVDPKFRYASSERILYYMNYWRRNRDLLVLGMVGLYLANIVDATVDAYLYDYNISPDLSIRFAPMIEPFETNGVTGMKISLRF
ncbi:MAG: DUF5683 domain-containing protein [Bacteroidales bacterium]|nr:DUF5683 domain-containing protein [Bacteroidales bacterium]